MEQGNVAKKLTGQILENWLLSFADGHGGIQTITKTTTSGLVDTYTITFSDTTTSTFTVTNGRSISNVTTSKSGKVTTVTISYNDGTSSSFTVRDGENVTGITEYWAVSTSGSSQPQSGWQTTPPTMTSTYKYLWHYSQYTYSDNTTTATTPAVQGVYGDKGDTGNTGTSITSVTKTGTSGLVDTYTITFSNGTTTTFQVTNGSEIESIEKTSTAGLVDTYTVTMGSGDTHTFTVTNGRSIVSFTQTSGTHAAGTIDVYTMTYNDGDTSQIQVYNGANGTGAVSTVAGIGVSSAEGDVPLIIKGYGDPTTATVGQVNQLYFDMTGGIMYICISTTGGSYDWRGMSSAVDSAMSTTSANPLQNRVISNKVGVGSLSTDFAATNLTDAANELQTKKANLASPTFTGTPKAPTAVAGTNNTQIATTAFVQDIASDLNGAISDCISANVDEATTIPNGTNYNTLTTPGNYVCLNGSAAQTMTNQPSSSAHRLYVIQNIASDRITQIALLNSDSAKMLLRTLTSSGWSSWTEPSYRVQSQLTSKVEEDNTATQSYSVGDFLVVNANLYKVISDIANGGTISVGTNVTSTTVTEELKSLSSGVATRMEVQNINVPKNTTGKHISASEKRMLLLFAYGTTADRCGLYLARLSPTAGSSQIVPILAVTASNVTIEATSTGVQVINNNVASNDYILAAVDGKSIDSLTIT